MGKRCRDVSVGIEERILSREDGESPPAPLIGLHGWGRRGDHWGKQSSTFRRAPTVAS
jgi:hypothetical protein